MNAGQEIRRYSRDDSQAQAAAQRIARLTRGSNQILGLAQDDPRPSEQGLTGSGDQDAPTIPLEQACAEGLLELGELGTERELRDVAELGGAAKAERLRYRDRVLELSQ